MRSFCLRVSGGGCSFGAGRRSRLTAGRSLPQSVETGRSMAPPKLVVKRRNFSRMRRAACRRFARFRGQRLTAESRFDSKRLFNKLKNWRRVATRYDQRIASRLRRNRRSQTMDTLCTRNPVGASKSSRPIRLSNRVGERRLYRAAPVTSDVPERPARRIAAMAPDSGASWPGQKWASPAVVVSCRMRQDIRRLRIPCDRH